MPDAGACWFLGVHSFVLPSHSLCPFITFSAESLVGQPCSGPLVFLLHPLRAPPFPQFSVLEGRLRGSAGCPSPTPFPGGALLPVSPRSRTSMPCSAAPGMFQLSGAPSHVFHRPPRSVRCFSAPLPSAGLNWPGPGPLSPLNCRSAYLCGTLNSPHKALSSLGPVWIPSSSKKPSGLPRSWVRQLYPGDKHPGRPRPVPTLTSASACRRAQERDRGAHPWPLSSSPAAALSLAWQCRDHSGALLPRRPPLLVALLLEPLCWSPTLQPHPPEVPAAPHVCSEL